MNQAIRNAWIVVVAMFLVLLGAASFIQVLGAKNISDHSANTRQVYKEYGANRGPILVAGEPIAESVPAESDDFDYARIYHDTELYSGLTGFYSLTYGAEALESAMNDVLSGSSDGMFAERIARTFTGGEQEGGQIELTIDPEMQRIAYNSLADDVRGSIVISDPATGNILAMVSNPSYDPNELSTFSGAQAAEAMAQLNAQNISPYETREIEHLVAPGSTIKLVQTAAMLESGEYTKDSTLAIPNQVVPEDASTSPINNFEGGLCDRRNSASLEWIFAQSCNTPFVEAAQKSGAEPIDEMAEALGFNQSFEMPLRTTPSRWTTGMQGAELYQSLLGARDVQATALQMNMVAAAVANDGVLMKPQLIDAVRGPDLNLIDDPEPDVFSEPFSDETAEQLTQMMRESITGGTSYLANSPQVEIAAKTGTGQIHSGDQVPADGQRVHSWMTGFAPADDPQVVVTLVYENVPYERGHRLTADNMKKIMEAVVEQ